MSVFFHLNSRCANAIAKISFLAFSVFVISLSGCGELELNRDRDITEDLYHRLVAGMFEPENDPYIIHIRTREQSLSKTQPAVGLFVPFSWEKGSFWVKVDEGASIALYMDTEAIFSHINFFANKKYRIHTVFIEHPSRPVPTLVSFD